MQKARGHAVAAALVAVGLLVALALVAGASRPGDGESALPWKPAELIKESQQGGRFFEAYHQGGEFGGAGGEAFEALTALNQFHQARTAPGIVAPGAYGAAHAQLTGLPSAGASWQTVTGVPYDADDPAFRDWYSNSSGGSGLVTGRVTGLAADGNGTVYAAGAAGGVFRSTTGGGNWTAIADELPSLSSGALEIAPDGALWYATGEANTGGTSYVGSGVYRLANPTAGTFTPDTRVGGAELESTTINVVRFAGNRAWVATSSGIWWHDATVSDGAWTRSFAPSPTYLAGGANANAANAPYKNIVNDLAIDPNDPAHIVAAVGWRSGDTYNGFYETRNALAAQPTWRRINPTGGIDATDIGQASFAFSGDGKKLYLINQSPRKLNSFSALPSTFLDGIYVSEKGIAGPWNKIATSDKLGARSTGSALSANFGLGYSPGIQSWYNQLIIVNPENPKHVVVGLEEVYETRDGGATWRTIGPYWNFYFSCWSMDALYAPNGEKGCPQTTHPDQHSVAIGEVGGTPTLFIGNDGGVYKRPLESNALNRNGNATDWKSVNDGTMDALQYYAVGIGATPGTTYADEKDIELVGALGGGGDVIVSGGLQDNGGSIVRGGASRMASNFGGDGGDVLVNPANGCQIVQEYVYLAMSVTENCAQNSADTFADRTTWRVGPPDVNARFIAPFAANAKNIDQWIAAGNSLWYQSQGFGIRSGSAWSRIHTFGSATRVATSVAFDGDTAIAGWCGPCNNAGFTRGLAVLKRSGGTWSVAHEIKPHAEGGTALPNRYVGGVAIDPDDEQHLYVVMSGFSRAWSEGPGAGVGHVWESTDGGATWTLADGAGSTKFPDVPANSVKVLPNGGVVVGTDLAVLYRAPGSTGWSRLGSGLPLTVTTDVELGPDGNVYAATHGRGIWRIPLPA